MAAAAAFKESVAPAAILRRELAEEGGAASRTMDATRESANHKLE